MKRILTLLPLLSLVGCATITDKQPESAAKYAEVDVKTRDGLPEVIIYNVALSTGFSTKYFFTSIYQKQPNEVFLSPGTYLIRVNCYGTLSWQEAKLKATVSAGKKYWLGCETKHVTDIYSIDSLYISEQ